MIEQKVEDSLDISENDMECLNLVSPCQSTQLRGQASFASDMKDVPSIYITQFCY
jgi:hypothetical protein